MIEILLQTLATAIVPGSAVYCSGPVTSGRLYFNWLKNNQRSHSSVDHSQVVSEDAHAREVVERNCAALASVVSAARSKFEGPVINPGALGVVPGWRQADYREFWCQVIKNFAHTVVFLNGWEYSVGCLTEYRTAVRAGKRMLKESFEPLTPQEALVLLRAAESELSSAGVLSAEFAEVLADIYRTEGKK